MIVINASSSATNDLPPIPNTVYGFDTACYVFIIKRGHHNVKTYDTRLSDGLGMLVGQAAYALELWYEIVPDINPVLNVLRKD